MNDPGEGVKIVGVDQGGTALAELRALRRRIVDLWLERGVMLTGEEQKELRDEIRETCTLLTALTQSS